MSEKWMKVLLLKRKLLDLKSIAINLCEDYIFGKQKMVDSQRSTSHPK